MTKSLPDRLEIGKTCPECGPTVNLIVRTNTENGSQFLGCPNFPNCKHTEGIPEAIKMELDGQPKLF